MGRDLVDTRLGQALKQPVQRVLGRMGWELRRWDAEGSAAARASLMERHGVATVLDVGANVGQYATRVRLSGFQGDLLSFEPGPDAFARLERASRNDPRWNCLQVAAGSEKGELTLEVSQNSTSSSLLPISTRHVEAAPSSAVASRAIVPVERIDEIVGAHSDLRPPYLLKLDVQGFELAALAGASGIFADTPVVSVELSFIELFEGGAGYLDVLSTLASAGYAPVEVEPGFRDPTTGDLLQCDVTMVRVD